jgi:hypothetical protein
MKNLFVSPERVLVRTYRHGTAFRFAASVIMATCILQVPLAFGVLALWQRHQELCVQQEAMQAQSRTLQSEIGPLQEVKRKLEQVRHWEPIFRSRLPVSALLSAVEQAIPENAVLESLSIEADQFERVVVSGGIYRVPTNYRLFLQGETRADAVDPVQAFHESLLRRLPPGTEEVRSETGSYHAKGLSSFTLQYAVKPNGNYHALGLKRMADPDPL